MMTATPETAGARRAIDPSFGRLDVHCAAFVNHWLSMRTAEGVPHFEDWAAALPASFALRMFRAELQRNDARVLFLGSEISGGDGEFASNRSLYANMPHQRLHGLRNLSCVVSTPCGYCFELEHQTVERRVIRTQTVMLPLLTYRNESPQIVGFSASLQRKEPRDGLIIGTKLKVVAKWWLDVGAGVPATPPA